MRLLTRARCGMDVLSKKSKGRDTGRESLFLLVQQAVQDVPKTLPSERGGGLSDVLRTRTRLEQRIPNLNGFDT